MDVHTGAQLPNIINLALSFLWGWAAMCRLSAMRAPVRRCVVALYVSLFVASFFHGLQFYFVGTLAGWPSVATSCVVLALVLSSWPRWRGGMPRCHMRGA